MKIPHFRATALAAVLIGSASLQTTSGELPILDKAPWLGYFAAFEGHRYQIGVTGRGKVALTLMNRKGDPVGDDRIISITIGIEELMPGGKTQMREIKAGSLESSEPATQDLEKTVIRGKVTGGASFEVAFEQERGVVSIGGRVTDPGTLTKNPLRFVVRTRIPSAYPNHKKKTKGQREAFEERIEDDRIVLKWTDGKRSKISFETSVDLNTKEINGPGIADAELEMIAYQGKKLFFSASENSTITLSNSSPAPLHEGFIISWSPDAAKDPQGKARFSFLVR